jgi:hypothetical protein
MVVNKLQKAQKYYWDIMFQYATLYAIFHESTEEYLGNTEKNPLDVFIESISDYALEKTYCMYELTR